METTLIILAIILAFGVGFTTGTGRVAYKLATWPSDKFQNFLAKLLEARKKYSELMEKLK